MLCTPAAGVRRRKFCLAGTHSIMPCLAITSSTVPTRWSSEISMFAASTTCITNKACYFMSVFSLKRLSQLPAVCTVPGKHCRYFCGTATASHNEDMVVGSEGFGCDQLRQHPKQCILVRAKFQSKVGSSSQARCHREIS